MMTFADQGIEIPTTAAGPEVQTTCPKCSHARRKKSAKCLSVNIEKGVFTCHHCGWSGSLNDSRPEHRRNQFRRPDPRPQIALPQHALDWFHDRGITDAVLLRNRIDYGQVYFPQVEDHREGIIFPYTVNGELINRKCRMLKDKLFRLETGCQLVLYGVDDIDPEKPLIWVEGECDKLAVEVAGFRNCVSVPNGAPAEGTKNYESRFSFLGSARQRIEAVKRHVLAVDSDAAGFRLEAELSRRLAIEKCSRVRWPEGIKDANEMLVKHGADDLRWYIENTEPFPIEGVFQISDRRADLLRLYQHGFERGYVTGWPELDLFYTVRAGEFTAVTGIPSSGKSNWLDNLLVNLARLHGWRKTIGRLKRSSPQPVNCVCGAAFVDLLSIHGTSSNHYGRRA
jgi:twinkle protein